MATNVTSLLREGPGSASCRILMGICALPKLVMTTRQSAPSFFVNHYHCAHASLDPIANAHAYVRGLASVECGANSRLLRRNSSCSPSS